MKTRLNFLMVLALLVMLVGATASAAHAEGDITISPSTPPDGVYRTSYSYKLTASGGSGSYTFSYSGNMPAGMALYADGTLEGSPLVTGTFTFTALVNDVNNPSLTGSQQINLTIGRAAPTVTVWSVPEPSTLGTSFTIWATAGLTSFYPDGTFAFYLDDASTPIPGCEAVPMGTPSAYCSSGADFAGGEHILKVVYTPSVYWSTYLESATGTAAHTIGYQITGTLFNDADRNGSWDIGESANDDWLVVKLDKDCDRVLEDYKDTDWVPGQFAFLDLLPGSYCLNVDLYNRYTLTSQLDPIALTNANVTINIGLFHPEFVFSPDVLPDAQLSVPYSQEISISGGTAPYTITMDAVTSNLPVGLTFDQSTNILSGTPTQAGRFYLDLKAQDDTGVIQGKLYEFSVLTNGVFNLSSSANPSASEAEVTFTLEAKGDVEIPGYGPFPPVGFVAFYDGENPIDGCSNLMLNYDPNTNSIGDFPVKCTTSTLSAGSHVITATYMDTSHVYYDATLTLIQMVTEPQRFTWTTPVLEGGIGTFTALLPAGATIEGWSRSTGAGGLDCDMQIGQMEPQIEMSFGASGDYQACLNWRLGNDYHIEQQTVTVENVAPAPISEAAFVSPEPSVAGAPLIEAYAAFFDWDHLASCTVDYGDGSGPQAGTIPAEENVCVGPLHTYASAGVYPVTFTATDPDGASGTSVVSHTVTSVQADLSLTNTDSKDPIKLGANLVYTLTIRNAGPDTAQKITVLDTLDRNTTYVSVSAPKGWTCGYANNKVTCTGASLATASSAIIKITVTVNKTATVGKDLINTAAVSSTTYDPNTANNTVTQKTMVIK